MTKPVKWADRINPDAWVVWDDGLDRWVEANLIQNSGRPEPLLIDEFGRHHVVGNETRCQRARDLLAIGDLTKIPHSWLIDETRRLPSAEKKDFAADDATDFGFSTRDWRNVR